MSFNRERHRIFSRWLGGLDAAAATMPTATAVGWGGADLLITCLSATRAGLAIENPRQVPAYRYSARYGPVPPCFSRALVHRDPERGASATIFAGGTSSVVGEASVHRDPLEQTRESFRNLEALTLRAVGAVDPAADVDALRPRWADLYRELRVYYRRARDRGAVGREVAARFPRARRIELMRADICRAELLVEIAGLASWAGSWEGSPS
jgi:chorismate lyase/3-hydroxybenzoate synthase